VEENNNGELAVNREPAHPFDQFRREMDQLFDGFLSEWPGRTSLLDRRLGSFVPHVDLAETDKKSASRLSCRDWTRRKWK
jgi:hypothetical protein